MHLCVCALAAAGWLASATGGSIAAARPPSDGDLPKAYRRSPYSLMSLSVGTPTNGWQIRAKLLRESESLFIQDKSKDYAYGHPALVLMLHRTSKQIARQTPGSVLLVGDLSRENGGPLAGHRSHQSGRDADVGFFVRNLAGQSVRLDRLIAFDRRGLARDGTPVRFDDYRNWLLVQLWLKDTRAELQHVFVARHLRRRLLDFARARSAFRKYAEPAAKLMRQPTNSLPHDDHFHVRIACPERQESLCTKQFGRR